MSANESPTIRHNNDDTVPPERFPHDVRDALTHLYDAAHLQRHPLGDLLLGSPSGDTATAAQALRRALLNAIELLRPADQIPYGAREWRPYRVLFQHYVQRMPPVAVAQELAISDRQYQREHSRALAALSDILWSRSADERRHDSQPGGDESRVSGDVAQLVAHAEREPIDAEELLSGTIRAVGELARSRQWDIALVIESPRCSIYGDRALLRQVVLNVLSCLVMQAEGGQLQITLDGGASAEDDDLHLCFLPLHTQPNADFGSSDRIGLGRQLAEQVGGELWVDNGEIHLALPCHRDVLLVVDDNQDVIDMLRRFLATGRYRVIGARSASEALRVAAEVHPFLIMLDVMMPRHDGWEALQSLKHNPETHDIPVAVCSILREQDLAYSLGADDYVQKPVSHKALAQLLQRWEARAKS